jgi:hypothetical protein
MGMKDNWKGLMKVIEVQKFDQDGNVTWFQRDVRNLLHSEGEEYILKAIFSNEAKPINYYLGLDNRASVNVTDTMTTIVDSTTEPNINGYTRQQVSSSEEFTVSTSDGVHVASGPVVLFSANGGSWGPVQNFFLTTQPDASGFLVSTVRFSEAQTVDDGESIAMRMSFSLRDCPIV